MSAESAQKIIDGFSLDNILQISAMERKTQTLEVRKEDNVGYLDVDQGELINAQFDETVGLDAAIEILTWEDVQISLRPLRTVDSIITNSLMNILLEVSKLKDERKSRVEESGEDKLASAIFKAEQHQYKEAHKDLVIYLKKNRNNPIGWIWYSRIQGNVESMKRSLDFAASIAPDDTGLQEELDKFNTAKSHLKGSGVRKCFFCWTPLDKGADRCCYCQGFLTVSRESFKHLRTADTKYMEEARVRYSRVLKRQPRSISAIYCLALINLNTGDLEEALSYLDRASKMAPDKAFFSSQLKLLMAYLARVVQAQEASPAVEIAEEQAAAEPDRQERKTILVIEDSSTTRKVICIALNRNGYRAIEAADGLEALSKISEERPDLIMLDVILPKMDGYKILSIIKGNREFKDIPVIMLTSKDGFINKMKGKMAGSAAYLTKPFDPDKMIAEIERYI